MFPVIYIDELPNWKGIKPVAKLKAIRITEENKNNLANYYGVESPEDLIEPGYWMVFEFGVEDHFEVYSNEQIITQYTIVKKLLNDYVEIVKNT